MAEDYRQDLALVRYHVWFPGPTDPFYLYNPEENRARNDYYGNFYSPHFFIDGDIDGQVNIDGWEAMIVEEIQNPSPLIMEIDGDYDYESLSGEITVSITAESNPGLTNLRLRIALTESNIYLPAPNGGEWHHQTFRDMIPSTDGQPVEIAQNETVEFTFQFSTPDPLVAENCELVAFVQSDQNRHILQAARVSIPDLVPTDVEDDQPLPQDFALKQNYPNPFNAQTRIDFRTGGGHVRLEIYDISGAFVTTLVDHHLEAGSHSVIWDGTDSDGDGLASGVYLYLLKSGTARQVRRMTFLK